MNEPQVQPTPSEPPPPPPSAPVPVPAPVSEPAPAPAPAPARDRRVLRAVLRWTAAVLVFATAGAATAYAVTLPDRTELPGLATPHDGRWTYPELRLPKLPSGAPAPFAAENTAGRHYADIRELLLPAPGEAKSDKAFPGAGKWLPQTRFTALFDDPKGVSEELAQEGCRGIAARAWTTPDGTRTEIYLLQFSSMVAASRYIGQATMMGSPQKAQTAANAQEALDLPVIPDEQVTVSSYAERDTFKFRHSWILAGDVVGLIRTTHKEKVPTVPYEQTLILQSQLLR